LSGNSGGQDGDGGDRELHFDGSIRELVTSHRGCSTTERTVCWFVKTLKVVGMLCFALLWRWWDEMRMDMRELAGKELGTYTFLLLPGCLGFMLAVLHYAQQCPTKGRLCWSRQCSSIASKALFSSPQLTRPCTARIALSLAPLHSAILVGTCRMSRYSNPVTKWSTTARHYRS
jgi:hypothetical protein